MVETLCLLRGKKGLGRWEESVERKTGRSDLPRRHGLGGDEKVGGIVATRITLPEESL